MTRTRSLQSALLLLAGAACCMPAQAAEELRIGFIAPKTGIFAQLGTDMQNGLQMYLDEHQGMLGGAKVTLIVEDDQGKPDTGVTKANKLILSDKVNMLVGGVLATTGYALAPVATREKMLYLGSIATADDLGQRDFDKYPYMVRPTFVPSQPAHPLGQWACE
jgi:branched-chain amino acid transport system substrate-binding protein